VSAAFKVGGTKYATLTALSYRQVFASCKLVWNPKTQEPWFFMKEISSDGDLQTVDVIFPASPLILYIDPNLLTMFLKPLLSYANNETYIRWTLPFAPHDLGFYPIAFKDIDQENMPIEETGNFLMMVASIVKMTKNIDFIVPKYAGLLDTWGTYLMLHLPDPENQLCTDDFNGPSPHNTNLAIKGIIGLGALSLLWDFAGDFAKAEFYNSVAKNYIHLWIFIANQTDHYGLQYDLSNTWSLKYNLLFASLLDMVGDIIPSDVLSVEISYYMKQMNTFGIPLDCRSKFTKLDWQYWIAAIAEQSQFQTIVDATYQFAHMTGNRVPLTDFYWTDTAAMQQFQARPVVGALFAKMLFDIKLQK